MQVSNFRVAKVEFEGPYGVAITFEQDGDVKIIRASGTSAQQIRDAAETVLRHLLETDRTIRRQS